MHKTLVLTVAAMLAFAANSLIARLALAGELTDAGTYTAVRIISGALLLLVLLRRKEERKPQASAGSWPAGLALFVYALAFSFAYLLLGAATGALILFAAVQATMMIWGIVRGERPGAVQWAGLLIAFAAFIYLLLPGIATPHPLGSLLMIASGIAWGVYSLLGRGSRNPIGDTAGNFARAALCCLPLLALPLFGGHVSVEGLALAVLSGTVASALGYIVWYTALPGLTAVQASVVQLSVPVIAAAGGALLLGETLTLRFVLVSVCILAGIALATLARARASAR